MPARRGNRNAAGPRTPESQRRIGVTFSVSGMMLELFRKRLAEHMKTEPDKISVDNIRDQIRQLALQAVEDYNATPVPSD